MADDRRINETARHSLQGALYGAVAAFLVTLPAWLMQTPRDGDLTFAAVCYGGLIVVAAVVFIGLSWLGVLMLAAFRYKFGEILPWLCMALLFTAIPVVSFVAVPKWDRVVDNVRDGYRDYRERHEGESREDMYGFAEAKAETLRPAWEWLANLHR